MNFLGYLKEHNTPFDFFSWHIYSATPRDILELETKTREALDSFGFTKTESILDEWNYVKGWNNDEWLYSLKQEKSIKGAAFVGAVMFESQYRPLDILMYYDARPCSMNGMFATDFVCDKLKGYYPFRMFNELVKLGNSVKSESESNELFSCAAKGENAKAFVVSYFDDNENAPEKEVKISFENMGAKKRKVSYFLLDENHDAELIRDEIVTGESISSYIKMPLYSVYLIKIEDI